MLGLINGSSLLLLFGLLRGSFSSVLYLKVHKYVVIMQALFCKPSSHDVSEVVASYPCCQARRAEGEPGYKASEMTTNQGL